MEQFLPPIHLACYEDEMRRNLALVEVRNSVACASNGIILVKIDLIETAPLLSEQDRENMEGKYIHMKAWAEIHKADTLLFHDTHIEFSGNGIKKTYYYENPQGQFFNTDTIVEDIREAGVEAKEMLCFNTKQIAILSKIFKHEVIHFSPSPGFKGVIAFPFESSGMFAVIMPISTEGVSRYYFRN
jgi:hypothetical protein